MSDEPALLWREIFDTGIDLIVTEQWDTKHPACPDELRGPYASVLSGGQRQFILTRADFLDRRLPPKERPHNV